MGRIGDDNWTVGGRLMWETVQVWIHGPCTALDDMEGLISGLNYFSTSLSVAEHVTYFSGRGAGIRERLETGRGYVDGIIEVLEIPQQACADFRSVTKIREGIATLNRIGAIQNDPTAAAVAFGQIFSGLGELSSHLPFPANSYSDFLAASGDFFSNMQPGVGLGPADRRARRQGVHWGQRQGYESNGQGLISQ